MQLGRRTFVASSVASLLGVTAFSENAAAEISEYIGSEGYVDTEGLRLAIKHRNDGTISEQILQTVIEDWERRRASALNPANTISQHEAFLDGRAFEMDINLTQDGQEQKQITYAWDGNARIREEGTARPVTATHHYTGDVQEFQLSHPEATSETQLIDDPAEKYMDGVSMYDIYLIGANVSFDADIGDANRYSIDSHRSIDGLQGELIVSEYIESFTVQFPTEGGTTEITIETAADARQQNTAATGDGEGKVGTATRVTGQADDAYVDVTEITPDPTEPLDLPGSVTFEDITIEYDTGGKAFNKANFRISENGYGGEDAILNTIDDPAEVPGDTHQGEWTASVSFDDVPDWDRLTLACSIYEDVESPATAIATGDVSFPVGADTPQGVDLQIAELDIIDLGDRKRGIDVAVTNMGRLPAEDVRVDLAGDLTGEFRDSPVDVDSGAYETVFTPVDVPAGETTATVRVDPFNEITNTTIEQEFTISVGTGAQVNIEDVSVGYGPYTPDETVPVEVTLDNTGETEDTFDLSVAADTSDASERVTLEPDASATHVLEITAGTAGVYDITVTAGEYDTTERTDAFKVTAPDEISLSVAAGQSSYEPGATAQTTLNIQGDPQRVTVEETLEFPDGTERTQTTSLDVPGKQSSRWNVPVDVESGDVLYSVDVGDQSLTDKPVFEIASAAGSEVVVNVQVPVNNGSYGAIDTATEVVDTGTVTLEAATAISQTLTNGRAVFTDIESGQYTLTITARNQQLSRTVEVGTEQVEWDFQLAPSGNASGMVFDAEGEHPLKRATVTIPALNASTATDELGRFLFQTPIPRGSYDLVISANGASASREYQVDASGFQSIRAIRTSNDLQLDEFNLDELDTIKSAVMRAVESAVGAITAGIQGLVNGIVDFLVDFIESIKTLIFNIGEVINSIITLVELVIDDWTIIYQMVIRSIEQFRQKQQNANPYSDGVRQTSFKLAWYGSYILMEALVGVAASAGLARAIKSLKGFVSLSKALRKADLPRTAKETPEAPGVTSAAVRSDVRSKRPGIDWAEHSTGWSKFIRLVDEYRKRANEFPEELFSANPDSQIGEVAEFVHGFDLLTDLRNSDFFDAPVVLSGRSIPDNPEPNTYYLVNGRQFKDVVDDGEFDWTIVKTDASGEPTVEAIREVTIKNIKDSRHESVRDLKSYKMGHVNKIEAAVERGEISPDDTVFGNIPAKAFNSDSIDLTLASTWDSTDVEFSVDTADLRDIKDTLKNNQGEMSRALEDGVQRVDQ